MRRFVYAPDVNAYILTDNGMIDVSADIISGSVTRRINAVSSAQLTLQNPNRKYLRKQTIQGQKLQESGDLLFKPMDRIVIYLTRVKSIPVFSGYIDRAPYDQLYPGPVNITASCTLKRLQYTFWDTGLVFVQKWLMQYGWTPVQSTGNMMDAHGTYGFDFSGGLGFLLHQILNQVGGWPVGESGKPNTVHILELPDEFISKTKDILASQISENLQDEQQIEDLIKTLLTPDGIQSVLNPDGQNTLTAKSSYTNSNPIPGSVAGDYNAKIFGEARAAATGTKSAQGMTYNAAGIKSLWLAAGGSASSATVATAIALAESGGRSWAHSATDDLGVWQINHPAHPTYDVNKLVADDQAYNASAAVAISQNGNFNPWSTFHSQNGQPPAYLSHMAEAQAAGALVATGPAQGVIGDVQTNISSFFKFDPNHQTREGYTFTAKKNPFGDDSLVFKAKYNAGTPAGYLSFYVPGADNKAPPWADKWTNHKVTVSGSSSASTSTSTSTTSGASTGSIADKIVSVAVSQVGVHETGYNTGPTVNKYIAYAGGSPGQPWCAAFVSWVYGQAGMATVKTMSAGSMTGFGKDSRANPTPGDIVVWGQDHTGIVVRVSGTQFWTVEGNAGNNTNSVVRGGPYTVGQATPDVHGDTPSFVSVPGIGTSTGDLNSAIDPTGVGLDITSFSASTAAGFSLGFPALADMTESLLLSGPRALANDTPLLEWIEFICQASGRSFMSTPRGDFLAFYPDYFNWTQESPYFTISGIETIKLDIDVGDEELTTHVFTTGDIYPGTLGTQFGIVDKMASSVASVEDPKTFSTLVNAPGFDVSKFLQRYGARPHSEDRPEIKHALLQFMYGWMYFLQKWAKQFYCEGEFTFMPELIPGGLVDFYDQDLIMFVQEVTHTFDRTAGFSTTASLVSPSTRGGSNPAMVLSGGPAATSASATPDLPNLPLPHGAQ